MKLLLLLAVAANAIFVASSDGGSSVKSSSSSSSFSSSSGYSTSSSSNSSSSSSSSSFDSYEDCSEEEQCGKNERYEECPATLCEPETCDDLGCSLSCAVIEEDEECPVKPACVCINDYVRNSKGVCIPRDECPSCGGDPNAVSGCGNNCGRLCSNYYKTNISCTLICEVNGCDCRENYVYDEEAEKCVLPEECTNMCKKANEVFDPCPAPCPFRTCGIDDRVIFCAPGLKVGDPKCPPPVCRCKDGYYRNRHGECVAWEECPKCPNPNEVFDPCPKLCPPQRCDVDERAIRCKAPPKLGDPECEPGCRCADGYVRNNKGICVTRDQCPKCTRPNEVFHPCPPTCPPQTCDSLTRDVICPGPYGWNQVSQKCNPSCICQPGYYRNKIGECISKNDCLRCTGPHEYFSCGSACDNVCTNLHKQNQTNCPIKNVDCNRQCYCEKGYARDRNNICIPIDQCPVSCAGDTNALPGCGVNCGRRCNNYFKKNVVCPDICFDDGCDCRPGYVFDGNIKRCVRPEDCTPVCGRNEVFSNCINGGCDAKDCSQLGKPVLCVHPEHCIKGCLCKEGYLRDKNGTCVPEKKCPKPIKCGNHEIYEECPPLLCQALNCSQLGHPIACPAISGPGCPFEPACICETGYLRNDDGDCIPEKQCPSCGGDSNAQAGCGVNCGRRCSNYDKGPVSCIQACFPNACDCKKDYVLDENINKCVLPKHCSPQCGPNEQYEECPSSICRAQNCSQLGYPIPCSAAANCTEKPACVCKDGYLRNEDGVCVLEEKCASCGGDPNARPGCGGHCGRRCSTYNKGPIACPAICFLNACDCKEGYIYDDNLGKCVRPEECTPTCGENEVYSECTNGGCQAKNCTQLGKPIPCIKINPKYCKKGCLCKEGYLRLENGTCVPANECPPQCYGKNEVYDPCPPTCPPTQTCDIINKRYHCPLILNDPSSKNCNGTCRCKPGYYRNILNECISKENCLKCNGTHEYFSCGGACDNVCSKLSTESQTKCPIINIKCNEMCYCEEGYARDENKICIPIDKCKGKICIPIDKCKVKPQCGKDEVYSECINGGCQAKNCSQIGKPIACTKIDPKDCIEGCLCKDGYLRLDNGTCVPAENCPPKCDQPNEIYDPCPYECPPQTCESLDKAYFCVIPYDGPRSCNATCRCKPGYYRNILNECISEENCLKCNGPHEYFSCRGACDNVCSNLKTQNQTNCPIVNFKCNEKCYCEDGYARDDNNTCIPINECKVSCGKNEEYNECPEFSCKALNCSQLGYPVPCPFIPVNATCPSEPACICKDGYLRNKKGICVPKNKCPSCGGDPNAQPGCGQNCGQRCSNYNKGPVACADICEVNGCDCKSGYVYDDNIGKCVPPKECTPVCGNYEIYSSCIQGNCKPQNCTQLGKSVPCPRIYPKYCIKGCLCKEGYLRDKNGTCIPEKKCPISCGGDPNAQPGCGQNCGKRCSNYNKGPVVCAYICEENGCDCKTGYVYDDNIGKCVRPKECTPVCGNNEFYSSCIQGNCKPQNCTQFGKPVLCPRIDPEYCIKGCLCKEGYLRDKNGTCIPEKECPNLQCGKDEVYEECPSSQCRPQKCSQVGYPMDCSKLPNTDSCQEDPACVCKDGYARNKKGKCIPIQKCPSCGGDPNAASGCGVNCNKHCYDLNKKPRGCPKICRVNACDCKDDYYYDDNIGKCVSRDQCTPTCGDDEVFSNCINGGCEMKNCSQLGKPTLCIDPLHCIAGCLCKEGYLRADNGTCVPEDQCKYLQCGEDEIYEECPSSLCRPQKCSQVGYPMDCSELPNADSCPEDPACICKDGYVRNKKGKCIPIQKCPSCGGDPNAASGCGVNCNKHCYDLNGKPRGCPRICRVNACDCKDDYYYDDNIGQCVNRDQCTPTCGDDEVFSDCVNGGCEMKNCSQLGKPILCIDPLHCIAGCLCKEGYLRADNGTCVPQDQCKRSCTNPNEIYDPCPPTCPPQTCESINQKYECPFMPANTTDEDCSGQCRCKPGYYRNIYDECISKEDCLKCTGLNEYFSCGSACDNVCTTMFKQNQTNCPIKNKKCTEKCYCEEGYARDKNNNCIPVEECPEPQCGEYERYEECPSCVRTPQYCSELGYHISCRKTSCGDEEPACVCIDGYVRNKKGKCIPAKQCPSCGGDPNAEAGCGMNCNRHCSDYNREPGACIELCKTNACDCKEGYYYDDNIGKCVLLEECTQVCGKNETYDTCVNGGCDMRNCSQLGEPILCIDPPECEDGCICKSGYLRDDDGTCVPEDECYFCPETTTTTPAPTTTTSPPTTTTPEPDYNATELLELVNQGGISYTGIFAYKRYLMNPGTSFVASPFSVFTPLALLGYFSENSTLEQILAVLNLKNKEEILLAFQLLNQEYKEQTEVILETGIKYYVNKDYPLTERFETIAKTFGSESQNVDFAQAQQTANTINKWVEEKTHDKIKNLVSPSMFNGATRLALVNAIYFMGNWTSKFNIKDTKTKDFYVTNNKTIQVPMMQKVGYFNYGENDYSQIVELPYKGGNYSCILVLPKDIDGVESVLKKLSKHDTYTEAIGNLRREKVNISVPRMDIKTETDLYEMLKITDLGQLTNTSLNDIHISKLKEALHVSSAVQKANIIFNESGTEAAAANAMVVSLTSAIYPAPKIYDFNANRPFILYVEYKQKYPLFCAVYTGV